MFAFVTSGDGFYVDGSFIQHTRHPYTGSYGLVLLERCREPALPAGRLALGRHRSGARQSLLLDQRRLRAAAL